MKWYEKIVGQSIYETFRHDESQTEIGKVFTQIDAVSPAYAGTFQLHCQEGVFTLRKIELECLLKKGVYHGCKIYLNLGKPES